MYQSFFFFSSRRRHTRWPRDWSSDVCSSDLGEDRVFDTPLAESAIGGLSIGLALEGYRPVPEIQFFGFVFEVMDSINGQMARMRYRSGGTESAPITIRSPFGGCGQTSEHHSDSLEE